MGLIVAWRQGRCKKQFARLEFAPITQRGGSASCMTQETLCHPWRLAPMGFFLGPQLRNPRRWYLIALRENVNQRAGRQETADEIRAAAIAHVEKMLAQLKGAMKPTKRKRKVA
jgi:hypothetical protein